MLRYLWLGVLLLVATAGAELRGEYRLGPGDVVKVSVYDHPDLLTEAQLTQNGELNFPLIGKIAAGGRSFTEVEQLIARKLGDGGFIRNAQVNVLIAQYRSQRVSVLGEVSRPGRYALENDADVVEMIATAGGIGATGGDRLVLVRGETRQELLLSTLLSAQRAGDAVPRVRNGDVVFVPRMQQVYVYGEVNRPGSFRLEERMTVMQAIASAGGYNPRASRRSIEIHRRQADGSVAEVSPKLTDAVLDNDVIYVQESLF
ncbi:SLBB domain-containing protein [Jeongeupia naejangsanensis]|uniref:SLBB domain-containing protein n=1 Tax=Jeongeupia naejangsanensis TaxID=613195 RepID=A0ABS2BJ69_9NEIS|nr:SLBB domain-containing protein [Jeongeupia naejangsanensis]MBM3115148.1 SLBB domain-containing protein [Jeongeupia naejangsanensis]